MNCSIAKTLDVIGEWWTPLILRDVFRGIRRFDDIQASLGMARSVLTARLRKLTEQGILERHEYSSHPPRYEYRPTEKGLALFPVIAALMKWGDTWAAGPSGAPVVLVHEPCGNAGHPILTCPHCGDEMTTSNTHSEPGPGASARGAPARGAPARGASAPRLAPPAP
ncbi:MAG: helix-turn-helix transcriptional regulator [Streptosporangiaceae bacterium]|nr:helix-turn-helix transcriptional regulator [Streptosporangiaceae bacterium]